MNDGNTTILCTKVSINTKEPVEIKEPSEGEEVDAQEYQEITARKIEEMQQNFGNVAGGQDTALPEPATAILILFGLSSCIRHRHELGR